jgi:hypothetical protein
MEIADGAHVTIHDTREKEETDHPDSKTHTTIGFYIFLERTGNTNELEALCRYIAMFYPIVHTSQAQRT